MQFNKSYYEIFNQHPQICENIWFHPKQKKISLRPKMLHLDVLCSNFEKPFSYLKSAPSSLQCLVKKIKTFSFGTKNTRFTYFGLELSYLKSAPSNLFNSKTSWNNEMPKFGTKNALYVFFWTGGVRIFKKLFSYLKLSPRMSNFKILQKQTKILQFGTKNALFECFGG